MSKKMFQNCMVIMAVVASAAALAQYYNYYGYDEYWRDEIETTGGSPGDPCGKDNCNNGVLCCKNKRHYTNRGDNTGTCVRCENRIFNSCNKSNPSWANIECSR